MLVDELLIKERSCIYAFNEEGKKDLIKRITDKHGLRILDTAQALGLGSKDYILMTI